MLLQEIEIDRLGDELEGTKLLRSSSSLIIAVRSDHHDGQIGATLLDRTERFTAATGGDVNGMLSQQQAKAAGWGFVSDHFSEIDQSGSGYVRLDDVLRFQSQRTPQQVMRMKAAAKTSNQTDNSK